MFCSKSNNGMTMTSDMVSQTLKLDLRLLERRFGHEGDDDGRLLGDIAAMGELAETFDIGRPSEEIALHLVAKLTFKEREFGRSLDPLGEDRKIERAAEPKHRAHDRGRLLVDIDRLDEGAVDLDLIEWKGSQIRQRRVAGTEIVHRDSNPKHLNSPQRRQCAVQVAYECCFGNLQFQPPGGKPGFEENLMHHMGEVCVVDLYGRNIPRDGKRFGPGCGLTARLPEHPFAD